MSKQQPYTQTDLYDLIAAIMRDQDGVFACSGRIVDDPNFPVNGASRLWEVTVVCCSKSQGGRVCKALQDRLVKYDACIWTHPHFLKTVYVRGEWEWIKDE